MASIGSAPAPVSSSTASGGASSASEDFATVKAWLLFSLRTSLDENGDGKLSFKEFSDKPAYGSISVENQAKLAPINQDAFNAIEQAD